jgi:hypothetical protein
MTYFRKPFGTLPTARQPKSLSPTIDKNCNIGASTGVLKIVIRTVLFPKPARPVSHG